jgi:hypothetical protein
MKVACVLHASCFPYLRLITGYVAHQVQEFVLYRTLLCRFELLAYLPTQLSVNCTSWLEMLSPLSTDTTTTSFCLQLIAVLLAP